MTASKLIKTLSDLGFEPEILFSGRLAFRGPRGRLNAEMLADVDRLREEMAAIVRSEASYPIPTAAANLPPKQVSSDALIQALGTSDVSKITDKTTLSDILDQSEELFFCPGDMGVVGKVIGYGDVFFVDGSIHCDGDILPLGGNGCNYFVVSGNIHCRHIVVPENTQLIVGGDLCAKGLAATATRDSMGLIGGNLNADTILSGKGAGSFSVAGQVNAKRIVGYIGELWGGKKCSGEVNIDIFDKRAIADDRLHADVLVALVACGFSPFS